MTPLNAGDTLSSNGPTLNHNDSLSKLITAAIASETDINIIDDAGTPVGTVDRVSLLRTVIEGAETS